MKRFWVAVRIRTGFENVVTTRLSANDVEVFFPRCQSRRRSDLGKTSATPLLPNYVFCRIHPGEVSAVLKTPGVMCFVGIDNVATPFDDVEIAALKAVVQSGLHYELCSLVNAGQKVVVANGPLKNVEGILVASTGDYRLALEVSFLQCFVLVELARGTEIVPVPSKHAVNRSD